MNMIDRRDRLAEVFRDTQAFYKENRFLKGSVDKATANAVYYPPDDYPELPESADKQGAVRVSGSKTFEAAVGLHKEFPGKKIAVLNFASATNPGGGVKTGSSAQEESLCRCSTLYPTLNQQRMWDLYYSVNRARSDPLHTDACIYSPGIVICKTDEPLPQRLPEARFLSVDVITCAAPDLRERPANFYNPDGGSAVRISPDGLYELHLKRAKHILHVAACNGVEVLVLGAFGCGAFHNDPNVVAKAYRAALKDYGGRFDLIEFAVYCRDRETENYDAFKRHLLN